MQSETYYHIYNHANGFENLFQSDENYRFFLQQWGKYIEPVADTYAYCLMPNHIHFLIRTKSEQEICRYFNYEIGAFGKFQDFQKLVSKQFANLFSSYTQAFNKQQGRKGSLFTPNFKRKLIENDTYLANIIFYIHHNPVHHGFTNDILEWPHNSIHAILFQKVTQVKRNEVINWFGDKQQLKEFHQESIKDLEKLELRLT